MHTYDFAFYLHLKKILRTPCNTLGNIPYNQTLKRIFLVPTEAKTRDLRSRNPSAVPIPERGIIIMHCACLLSF